MTADSQEKHGRGRGLTANNVRNSTRPTAALRRLPRTSKYPISTIDSADKTIRATCQFLPEQGRVQ